MKKLFTLLLVFSAFLLNDLFAQCNAEFTFTVNGATGQVQFIPSNTSAVGHSWHFGDGNSSDLAAPVHVYAPGTYNVLHIVTSRSSNDSSIHCVDSASRWVFIAGQPPCTINAAFSFRRDSVQTNKVFFTNLSTGISPNTVTQWNFGDGTVSFESNPIHVFPASGVYRVCLTVRRDNLCADDTCVMVQVQAPACDLTVNFSSVPDSLHPNIIRFANLTTPPASSDSLTWHFGDGQISHESNPLHTYSNGGIYNVCLVVKRFSATGVPCIREFCRPVTVISPCNILPNFVFRRDSTSNQVPATYYFTNTTAGLTIADSSFWNFGDGTPVLINPSNPFTHTYERAGIYQVCLTVKKVQPGSINIICTRYICRNVVVDSPQVQCNLQAYFTANRDSSLFNKFFFNNQTQGFNSTDSIRWLFGDGSSSTNHSPTHIYNAPGTYQVCLRVKRVGVPGTIPCVDEYCRVVIVEQPAQCNLIVNFADSVSGNTVYFTNQSVPLAATDSIRWTFGDGSASNDANPVHSYNQPGSYVVCLRVKRALSNSAAPCVRELCRVITILPPACNIVVSFTAVRDSSSSNTGHTFIFTNTSVGLSNADSSFWHFGDGTPAVYASSATVTHTFTSVGTFNVCLLIKKVTSATTIVCVREFCRPIIVQQTNTCNLVPNFTYQSDSINGGPGNVYHFTNTSEPLTAADSSFWNFGDGSPVFINPGSPVTHSFAHPGVYTVCLLVKKVVPGSTNIACERRICKLVVVVGVPDPCSQLQVDFAWRRDSSNSRLIHFINQTTPVTANIFVNWHFGDGTGSELFSPQHVYANPGIYTVCMRAQMANCVKDTCKVIVIYPAPVDSCIIQPRFITRLDSANRRKVYFVNTTPPATASSQVLWHFGDGSSATGWNVVHEYNMPGHYVVCLTVTQGNNCSRTYCDSIFVPGNVLPPLHCDSFRLAYGYRRDNYMPNKLFFFATGNAPVYNQQWTFTSLNGNSTVTINQNNPVYVFPDTGLYRVCVTGSFSNNCTRQYCDEVNIFSTSTPSQCILQAYPNPAHHSVFFNVHLNTPGIISSTVFNSQGMPVMQFTQTGVTGNNLVALGIQNLVPGFYTVRILHNGRVCFTRFQKI